MRLSDRHRFSQDALGWMPVRDRELSVVQSLATEPGPMTRFRPHPSGLLVPDYEARGFRPSAFGGRGGVFRSRGPGNVVTVDAAAPTVTSISPTSGPAGTPVTIVGTNFISGGLVTKLDGVNGVALTNRTLVNSTTITGQVGAHANGAVDVYVATDNGNNTLVGGFTYTAGPTLNFASAWGTALGTSSNAITDGGKFGSLNQSGSRIEVVDGAALGFPASNALRISYSEATSYGVGLGDGGVFGVNSAWPLPAIGETLFRRVYMRNSNPAVQKHHPLQAASTAGCCPYAAEHNFFVASGGTYIFELSTSGDGSPDEYLHSWRTPNGLDVDAVYRVEERFERIGTAGSVHTYNYSVRIHNAAGALLFSDSNFTCAYGTHAGLLPVHSLDDTVRPVIGMPSSCNGGECLRKLMIVNQGLNHGPNTFMYWSAIAILVTGDTNAWIGPYIEGEGA